MMKSKHYVSNGVNSTPVVVSAPAPIPGGFSITFAVSF